MLETHKQRAPQVTSFGFPPTAPDGVPSSLCDSLRSPLWWQQPCLEISSPQPLIRKGRKDGWRALCPGPFRHWVKSLSLGGNKEPAEQWSYSAKGQEGEQRGGWKSRRMAKQALMMRVPKLLIHGEFESLFKKKHEHTTWSWQRNDTEVHSNSSTSYDHIMPWSGLHTYASVHASAFQHNSGSTSSVSVTSN